MRKLVTALLVGAFIGSASAAYAVAAPTVSSVTSKSSEGAGLTEAAAEVKFTFDPQAAGVAYSVAAVASGEATHFGSTPSCEAQASICTSIVSGLNGGQQYSFYATAVQASTGAKASSAPVTFKAQSIPAPPTTSNPESKGSEVTLSWTAPSNNGGLAIDGYTITGSGSSVPAVGSSTSAVIKNLTYGTAYTFKIVAHNALGNSSEAQFATVTPTSAPNAPDAPQVKADGTSVVANWTAPASNGASITAYKVYLVDATSGQDVSAPTSATSTTATLANLASGSYKVQIVATNAVGDSARSPLSSAVPVTSGTKPGITTVNVRGTAQVGQTLTAVAGGVTGTPTPTATYQWKRAGSAISGATGSTYVLVDADLGKTITVTVTETNGVGTAAAATSDPTGSVAQADAAPTATSVSISGSPKVGQTLSATVTGSAGYPVPALAYQWLLGDSGIANATASTYQVRVGDLAASISVRVTMSNSIGTLVLTSPQATVLPADVPPAVGGVSISGVARVGQTLQVVATGLVGSPTPTAAYQWRRGSATAGIGSAATYTVQSADLGKTITVRVTYTNAAGNVVVFSTPTQTVLAATTNPTSVTVTVTGTATVGQTLTAVAAAPGAYPAPTFSYVWKRNGAAISGATASTYSVTSDDVGATLVAQATSSVGSVIGTSSATSAVTAAAPAGGSISGGGSSGGGSSGGGSSSQTPTPVSPTPTVEVRPVPPTIDTRPVTPPVVTPTQDTRPTQPVPVVITPDKPASAVLTADKPTVLAVTLSSANGISEVKGISVTVPAGVVPSGAKLAVAPAVSDTEVAAGYVTISVSVVDSDGKRVTTFDKPISLSLGKVTLGTRELAYSEDGLVWKVIQKLTGTELPDGISEGYYLATDGTVVVLTRHLTYFGVKLAQSALQLTSSATIGFVGESVGIVVGGGSGTGVLLLATTSPSVCQISGRSITFVAAGSCLVQAGKYGDGTYLNAETVALTLSAKGASLVVTGIKTTKAVTISAGTGFAGKRLLIEVRKIGSTAWKALKTVTLSKTGTYKGQAVIPARASVRLKSGQSILATVKTN